MKDSTVLASPSINAARIGKSALFDELGISSFSAPEEALFKSTGVSDKRLRDI